MFYFNCLKLQSFFMMELQRRTNHQCLHLFMWTLLVIGLMRIQKCASEMGWFRGFFEFKQSSQHFLDPIQPREAASKLLANETDELYLMFMGDTQYHFPCTSSNDPCKEASQEFRTKNDLNRVGFYKLKIGFFSNCNVFRTASAQTAAAWPVCKFVIWKNNVQ